MYSVSDNVCVEDGKQMVRRDGAWRGGRRGRGVFIGRGAGGGPRTQFVGNFSVHPLQQQQQGFAGPRFGVDGFVRPLGRPGARGGIYSRPQLSQQQPPHKILINPHFRGAVQPHPEGNIFHIIILPSVPLFYEMIICPKLCMYFLFLPFHLHVWPIDVWLYCPKSNSLQFICVTGLKLRHFEASLIVG